MNHYRSLLSLTYRLAIRDGKATSNPARATRHRREDNSRVRYLTPEEETKLRSEMRNPVAGHIPELDLALHTGLAALGDVRPRLAGCGPGSLSDSDSTREERREPLRAPKLGRAQGSDELRKRGDGTGPVIRNLEGEPLAGPRYWFEKAIRKAGIGDFHWHDLRHTFASRLTMAGVGLRATQDALGHKSIAMTVRYSHLAPDFLLNVVEKLVPQPPASHRGTQLTPLPTPAHFLASEPQSAHMQ